MRVARWAMVAVALLSAPAIAEKPEQGKAQTGAKKLDQKIRKSRKPGASKQLKNDLKKVESFLFGEKK